jgi:hypothetical protein
MPIHLLGIRHHGPGSARNVRDALHQLQPDIILVEGPPEGEALLSWVQHEDMRPPVALLVYAPDNPKNAVFYPFAEFSPEWQAISYGLQHNIPVRFIDIPLAYDFALKEKAAPEDASTESLQDNAGHETLVRKHPIAYLAEAAGCEDAEVWWEQQFELRKSTLNTFAAVADAMQVLREHVEEQKDDREEIREAFMRKAIRQATKENYQQIAVICGAWHVPALQNLSGRREDDLLLKGLPKVKVDATWIPWTYSRLSLESGYGAGIQAPGWYDHLWQHPDDDGSRWLIHVAQVFRSHQMDTSSAHIIESLRLAHALSAMRGLHKAGLQEMNEAVQTVMCMGDDVLLRLIWRELIVGHHTGSTPTEAPQVPLQRDLEKWQKKLRLKVQDTSQVIQLDLREESGLQKSILLHRLLLLEVKWGNRRFTSSKGTFKEEWELCWSPELSILLLEKAPWGNTVEEAANNYAGMRAKEATQLSEITRLLELALPAELQKGAEALMRGLDRLSASTSDVAELMQAFVPLAQILRYGNVRKTDLDTISLIMESLLARIVAGLPAACVGIDESTATQLASQMEKLQASVLLFEESTYRASWFEVLRKVKEHEQANPLLGGLATKMLYHVHETDAEMTALAFRRALSRGTEPAYASLWLEGFLKENATTLLLDDAMWGLMDTWLEELEDEQFQEVVPILRRTFSDFSPSEKRKLAQRAKSEGRPAAMAQQEEAWDEDRARAVLPILYKFMGIKS